MLRRKISPRRCSIWSTTRKPWRSWNRPSPRCIKHCARTLRRKRLRLSCPICLRMRTSNNLLRGSIHPQGVGRWVPGGNAATLQLAALHQRYAIHYPASRMWNCQRGTRSSPTHLVCLVRCADQRLGWRFFASFVEWPCKAPCAPSTLLRTGLLSKRRLRHVTGEASRLREQPPVAPPAPDASQHRVKATSLRFLKVFMHTPI